MPFLEKQLFIKESTIPGAGSGLFAKEFIPKGSRITEYKGKISNWEDANHQEGLNPYIYFVSEDHVIDSLNYKKSLARYANDARGMKKIKGLLNNAVYVEEGLKVYIDAIKDIPPGTEIFVSYGKEYWDVLKENLKG